MNKIAVIQTAYPGDVILATPVFEALRDRFPNCVLAAVVRPESFLLLRDNPHIDNIIVYDKYGRDRGIMGLFRVARLLKGFDWAIIIQRYLRSALLPLMAGIKKRTGYGSSGVSFLYSEKKYNDKGRHEVQRCLDLIDAGNDSRYRPRIFVGDEVRVEADKLLAECGVEGDFAVVAPGSVWATKRYPYYPELIDGIRTRFGLNIVLLGGAADKEISRRISDKCGFKPLDLTGETDLLHSAEIISRAKIVFSNDSAPAHMAAAVETPVAAIFGPTVPGFGFWPYFARSVVVDIGELYCRPCTTHGSEKCPQMHFRCMVDLKPERVLEMAESLIG
jgi:heptosyltransferase-2